MGDLYVYWMPSGYKVACLTGYKDTNKLKILMLGKCTVIWKVSGLAGLNITSEVKHESPKNHSVLSRSKWDLAI